MTVDQPWIIFHAAWTSRLRSRGKLLAQIERFLDASAVNPTADWAELNIHEDLGDELRRATYELPSTDDNVARALAAIGYQPGRLVEDAHQRFGPGKHRQWASGSTGFLFAWTWRRERPFELAPLVDHFLAHEALPPVASAPNKRAVDLTINYWFDAKLPGTATPLFPGSPERSSLMLFLGAGRVNLALRYGSPDLTPALAAAHASIVATLGPKPPRGVLQRIIPAKPGGRERRERIA